MFTAFVTYTDLHESAPTLEASIETSMIEQCMTEVMEFYKESELLNFDESVAQITFHIELNNTNHVICQNPDVTLRIYDQNNTQVFMTVLKDSDTHSALYAEGFNMTASVENTRNAVYHAELFYGDKDAMKNDTLETDEVHSFHAGDCRIEMVHFEAANSTQTTGSPNRLTIDFEVLFKHSVACMDVTVNVDLIKNGQYLTSVSWDEAEVGQAYYSEDLSIVTMSAAVDSFVGEYYAQIDIRETTTNIAYIYDSEVYAI